MDKKNTDINNTEGVKGEGALDNLVPGFVDLIIEKEDDDEMEALLPSRRGGLSKSLSKAHLKVQWNDSSGNQLAEVLEFQPSDVSDSEDEDSDSCYCVIM